MPKKKRIRVIIFDLGGVLVHGGYLEFINHYCMECLTELGKKKILELEKQVNLGNISENKFYKTLQNVFGVHLSARQMHEKIAHKVTKDKELINLIAKIGKSRAAMFTNSIGQMALEVLRLKQIPAKKLFRKVFVSTNLHMVKPEASAYRYILKKLKVRPNEAVMVDDRLINIQGARRAGMGGILYENASQFKKELKKYELR